MLNHNLVLKGDELYLVGEQNTDGSGERATGLYVRDTRHLSRFDIRLNDQPLDRLGARILGAATALVTEANRALNVGTSDEIRPHTVALQQRIELDDHLRVRTRLVNFASRSLDLSLQIEVGADFRDLFDIRGFPRPDRVGRPLTPVWSLGQITLAYRAPDGLMPRTTIDFDRAPTHISTTMAPPDAAGEPAILLPGFDWVAVRPPVPPVPTAVAHFDITLPPGGAWELAIVVWTESANAVPVSAVATLPGGSPPRPAAIASDNPFFNRFLQQCAQDLLALQTSFPEGSLPAAGIPWYVAPFGRDSLIVGLQTFHSAPTRAAATLRVLAALQGQDHNPYRDEEPGKILHEVRYGEMARLGEIPHTPYYGTVDATPLFVLLFAETVAWNLDEGLYRDLLPHVRRAIEWMEHHGDLDGDGLIEYHARESAGAHIVHQGWKDSHDSLHHLDGRPVKGKIALVEVQGYAYAAYRRLADTAAAFGDHAWAAELNARADTIRALVEERFWIEADGFYAQALDEAKEPVRAISSNAGHLLFCGLPSAERGATVAARLGHPDMDSGWGIRTLSAQATTYNPMSYHNGSVWPHDNSLIADGARRYGAPRLSLRIAAALFAVAETDPLWRLPELYCGFSRTEGAESDAPVPYPVSCSPQAWAAGAGRLLARSLLGLRADPVQRRLLVDPAFPAWIDRLTVDRADALGTTVSFTVARDGDGYRLETSDPVVIAPWNPSVPR